MCAKPAKLEEFFHDLDNLSLGKMENLVHESLKFFEYLRVKLQSDDPEEKRHALGLAQELQKKLEAQAEKAFKASGMKSKEELENFLKVPSNLNEEQKGILERAQQELFDYQSEVLSEAMYRETKKKAEGTAPIRPKKIKKAKKDWLHG